MSDKPEGISQDAWDEANAAMDRVGWFMRSVRVACAEAIMAATERERERCAEQAILHGHKVNLRAAVDAPLSSWKLQRLQSTLQTCEDIAALIRKPQNDNFQRVPHNGEIA